MDLGRFGLWQFTGNATPALAVEAERLGFGTVWIGGSPHAPLEQVEALLDATEQIVVATGIVNMWGDEPEPIAAAYHRIEAKHPGRFLLGVGIGHPEAVKEYRSPYDTIVDYLDRCDAAGVPTGRRMLAALGDKVLALSAARTVGAHPYLTTPAHTAHARAILDKTPLGDALLAPEHKVILSTDQAAARAAGRAVVKRYLGLGNYTRNLLRHGFTADDIANGGSDALVDALVLHGDVTTVADGLQEHVKAGADHVCIQVLGDDLTADHEALAEVLLG